MSSVGQQAIPSFVHNAAWASLTTGWWMWYLLMASCMLADTRSFSNLAEWTPTWKKYIYCMMLLGDLKDASYSVVHHKLQSLQCHLTKNIHWQIFILQSLVSYYTTWPHQTSPAYHKDIPSCWRVSWLEGLQVRQNVEAVDAAVSEKVQHTHPTFEILFQAQWMANIEPLQPWIISTKKHKKQRTILVTSVQTWGERIIYTLPIFIYSQIVHWQGFLVLLHYLENNCGSPACIQFLCNLHKR